MWIVVNAGGVEDGVSTNIVGVFDSEERARSIARSLQAKLNWREDGPNLFEAFPMPETNVVADEYQRFLDASCR